MSDHLDHCCATCHHWEADDRARAYVAPCALGVIRRPEFWQKCSEWCDPERAAAEQVTQQSACRPTIPASYGYWPPVKP